MQLCVVHYQLSVFLQIPLDQGLLLKSSYKKCAKKFTFWYNFWMNLNLWIFVSLNTLCDNNDEGMLPLCVCAWVNAVITKCVQYSHGFIRSAVVVVHAHYFLFTCFQATGWSVPLFPDWLTVLRTCWTSAPWTDSPSYVRVQRSEAFYHEGAK